VPCFAPRYPDGLYRLIEELDDETLTLAEVARRIGDAAQGAGMIRPSPVHVRRLLAELRELRRDEREIRAAGLEALGRLAAGRPSDRTEPLRTVLRARERVELRARRRAS